VTEQLTSLSPDESLDLLRSHDLGRLAVIVDDIPMVFPVNYAVHDDAIVIRTAPGTKWDAADGRDVCFEVDEVDLFHRSMWSVVIIGKAVHAEIEGPHRARPLVPGEKASVIRIAIEKATGRRLATDADAIELDPHGYL
jgi:nitroimidazol reductase NimA-like FMN-containing flavoprotein (pyridoxamine 5'-phosphate oxidase superfamily)